MSDSPARPLAVPGDTIAIAGDHAGVELKSILAKDLADMGFKVLDLGTDGPASVDYPDFGDALAKAVGDGRARAGVALCGTGIGISIAANRHPGIRAALVHDRLTAGLAREHNDANVIAMGARVISADDARAMLKIFLTAPFGGGRHTGRVAKLG